MVDQKFKEWACSLSGCDTRNTDAKTWLCGIEWGGPDEGENGLINYYENKLPGEIAEGAFQPDDANYDWQKHQEYSFGKSVAKLYAAYRGKDVNEYYKYLDTFSPNELCKMNLYPLAFRHTGDELWKTFKMQKRTGFADKELYRVWCFFNRFPFFAKLARVEKPELIICAGVSYLTDYIACFAGHDGLAEPLQVGILKPKSPKNQKDRRYYWARLRTGTVLVVIPFFSGSNGLNSYHLLGQMGKRLQQITQSQNPT